MIFILIVIALNGAVSFQEFGERRACKHAAELIAAQVQKIYCVPKHIEPGNP
jgi:hypothetical protein